MAKIDSFNEYINLKEVELLMIESLLKKGKVLIPDFGHLEIKSFGDNRTILLKSPEGKGTFLEMMSSISEKDKKDTNTLYKAISVPLKEGKIVNLPQIGVFRPVKRENGKIHLSFIPAISLRKLLSREKEDENEEVKEVKEVKEVIEEIINVNENEPPATLPKGFYEVQESEIEKDKVITTEAGRGFDWEEEPVKKYPIEVPDRGQTSFEREEEPVKKYEKRQQSKFDSIYKEKKVPATEIVKVDDKAEIKRSRNYTGTLLLIVALIALVIVVASNIISQSNKKEEEKVEILPPAESQFTLTSLAEQYYGHPAFWIYIYWSNIDKLNSPINISETVSLVIPDLKAEYDVDITDSLEIQRAKILVENVLKLKRNN